MEIEIDKISDEEVLEIFKTKKLVEMFYKIKAFANLEIGLYDINRYMEKNRLPFSTVKKGNGEVLLNVRVNEEVKFTFKY